MTQAFLPARGLALAIVVSLLSALISAHAAMPMQSGCSPLAEALPFGAADLGCLPHSRRVELLSRNVEPAVIAPLNREYRLHSALHRWKAKEAEALAIPPADRRNPLAAYLESRTIEAQRSEALKDAQQAMRRAEARILLLGADLKVASRAATQWIHRQPGRELPASYLRRIVDAADAILEEDRLRRARAEDLDEINRRFDLQLQQVLTLQG